MSFFIRETIKIEPKEEFTNITQQVQNIIDKQGIKEGICVVYSPHTTACIRVLEDELLLRQDMLETLERLAPTKGVYSHDNIEKRSVPPDERRNGYSHIRAMFLNFQETIPLQQGKLDLGKWQSIFYVECDPGKQERFLTIYLMGAKETHIC
jgi:secondary thiamine-phosphate synthase enzyme